MALPTRQEQIQEVAKFLDADHQEGRELAEIAADIVDAYHKLLSSAVKNPVLVPHLGMAFKHPALSGVWHVAHRDTGRVWCVSATSRYGSWIREDAEFFWVYAEQSRAQAGAPGNNPDWQVGDRVSQHQREHFFTVTATGDKCVLLTQDGGPLQVDTNDNMTRYYRREVEEKIQW